MGFTQDLASSEDLVQDVFVKMIDSGARFDSDIHFARYAYKSVRNACITHISERGRFDEISDSDSSFDEIVSDDDDDSSIVEAEMLRLIMASIDNLPPRYRQVFTMSYIEMKSNDEIAAEMGISVNTVKVMKQRARIRIKENIGTVR